MATVTHLIAKTKEKRRNNTDDANAYKYDDAKDTGVDPGVVTVSLTKPSLQRPTAASKKPNRKKANAVWNCSSMNLGFQPFSGTPTFVDIATSVSFCLPTFLYKQK